MKKILALILTLSLCLTLFACAGEDEPTNNNNNNHNNKAESAFENAKEAFKHITAAYQITNKFSEDIYTAWNLGITNEYTYPDKWDYDTLNIGRHNMNEAGGVLLIGDSFDIDGNYDYRVYGDYGLRSYADIDCISDVWMYLRLNYDDSSYSAWVAAVSKAYEISGKTEEINTHLATAKTLIKDLDNADSVDYAELKNYLSATSAFFDFCQNPEGAFAQLVETFNDYRNNARESFAKLSYDFCDGVASIDDPVEFETTTEEESY